MSRGMWMLLCVAALPATAAADVVLVKDGRANATVVLGDRPSAQAREAAEELRVYLKRMTGAELPVAESAVQGEGARVLVGQSAARDTAAAMGIEIPSGVTHQFNEEGYVVAAAGNTLILAGNETDPYLGTHFAVSDFLHSLGCRWFFPGEFGEVVPRLATVRAKPGRRIVRPDLRVRDTWYSGHLACTPSQSEEFRVWKRRNRMTRPDLWLHCASPDARYLQNPVDDSTYRLLPKEKYWESHPEYYAMQPGGARNDRFLCMSHPGALQAATDTVCEYFDKNPSHRTFAFSPPDAPVLCHCPDCSRAMNGGFGGEGNGDVSDPYFRFVFRLAEKVRQRYPDRWITTMAYYNRCRPPQGVEAKAPNLLLQLASIQQCSIHSYADAQCWSRQEFGAMLRHWAELTAGQVFYEYDPHDWTHLQRPAWRTRGIAEDLRILKSLGGWGYSNEGQMAWLSTGLNYYARARLAWGLKEDPTAIEEDFFRRFFGPAATPMGRYYSTIEQALQGARQHLLLTTWPGVGADDVFSILPRPLLNRCAAWLDQAARLATDQPYAGRVAAFRAHFDRMDACEKARAAMARGDYTAAARFGDAMVAAVRQVNNTMLLQDAGPWGGSVTGAAVAAFARKVAPWTDGTKGRLVAALPAEALFRTDAASEGVVHQWYRARTNARLWRPIRMTTGWYNQGVLTAQGRRYSGIAWYRVALDLQSRPSGHVRLYVPELRGTAAWVWVNGSFAGYLNRADDDEMSVAVTPLLRAGANEFIIRVQGDGGLTLPPFLFAATQAAAFPDQRVDITAFAAQWRFQTDPQGVGVREGWFREEFDDTSWRSIPVPSFWEDTPVGPYDGDAWYRVRFPIPAEARGKLLVLRFGAADEEAWVYLNGELLDEHTTASTGKTVHEIWDKPFEVTVKGARCGAENTLAVRVHDSMSMGGLHKPVRLYLVP